MSSLRRKGLVAAMEDGELGGEASGELAPVEMLEIDDAGITGDSAAIEDDSSAIAETTDDVEVLQDLQEVGEKAEEQGGLSPDAAEAMEAITNHIGRKLGIKTRIMPSMESFGSANSRKAATKLAMENIGDIIARVWQAIKDAIINLWKKIVAFVSKLFNGNLALEKSAKALKDRIKELKVSPEENDFEDSGVASNFGAEKVGATNVLNILKVHAGYCARAASIPESIKSAAEAIAKHKPAAAGAPNEIGETYNALFNFMAEGVKPHDLKTSGPKTYPAGDSFLIKGDVAKFEAEKKDGTDGAEATYTYSYSFEKSEKYKEDGKKAEMLTLAEMNSICDKVSDLAKANGKLADQLKAAAAKTSDVTKAIEKLVSDLKQAEKKNEEKATNLTSLRQTVNGVSTMTASFGSSIASKNITAGKCALAYVSKCASKYKTK